MIKLRNIYTLVMLFMSQVTLAENLTGSIEAGMLISSGNSKEESIRIEATSHYAFNTLWSNQSKVLAENKTENDIRSKEEYYINNQTEYKTGVLDYRFVEIEYVNDRYGGYNYRVSETIGYGYKVLNDADLKLSLQFSAGLGQEKLVGEDKDTSGVVRFGADFKYNINESATFNEDLDISVDQNVVITRSDANLRIKISQKLYLKCGVLLEHVSSVAAGIKKLDSTTMFTIGYDF